MADGVKCGCNVKTDQHGGSPVISSCVDTVHDVKQGGLGRVTAPVCRLQTGKFRRCEKMRLSVSRSSTLETVLRFEMGL